MAAGNRQRDRQAHFDMTRHKRLSIALVSDTHGVLDERIAALVANCDLAVHAGDVGEAGVLSQLQSHGTETIAVRGNNDTPHQWPRAQHNVLETLPDQGFIALPGGLLVVLHGHRFDPVAQRHDRLRAAFGNARVIVYGHSHRQVCDKSAHPWVINPGVAGRARTFGGPSCAILQASANHWTIAKHRFA
ncbi:MAG: metallophosphatase family protein [Gammaproteobacteria bacterium]|nr:metallophosphatase family protein [Gammaproteobacteria bacterium]